MLTLCASDSVSQGSPRGGGGGVSGSGGGTGKASHELAHLSGNSTKRKTEKQFSEN